MKEKDKHRPQRAQLNLSCALRGAAHKGTWAHAERERRNEKRLSKDEMRLSKVRYAISLQGGKKRENEQHVKECGCVTWQRLDLCSGASCSEGASAAVRPVSATRGVPVAEE